MSESPKSPPTSPATTPAPRREAGIPAFETRGLSKIYPGFWRSQSVAALQNLNLTVKRGEIFGLLGPNGSGKTTTIKLLLGLINPTAGSADVLGKPAGDQETRRSIGYLPEETYLYRFLNARQTLDFYARLFNMNRAARSRAIDYYLDFVGLDPAVRRRRIGTYSKGQARRVGLAQALLNDPELVILDEPTSGLDPLGTLEMKNLIKELKRAGKTVLLSSHQLTDVEDVRDRICILYRGRIEVEGTIDELLEVRDVFKVEARNVPPDVQARLVGLLKEAGVSDIQPGVQRSRLEDLFKRMVLEKRAAEQGASRSAGGQGLMFVSFSLTDIILISVRALIVLAFLAFGWRDILMLFRRPARNMGTGFGRIWAVGHTTMLEAWAGRIWLLPLLWLIASVILISVVRPFDETERMTLNIRMLLSGQELLLLVMMWAMACLSLPRERERKIIITNASKPLSRLEIVLGKITGFSAIAAVMLVLLGVATYGILVWQNQRIKAAATDALALQKTDLSRTSQTAETFTGLQPPPSISALEGLRDKGSLFAYNYIGVAPNGMSVAGQVVFSPDRPPVRYLKGGSNEKAVFRFSPRLDASQLAAFAPVGVRPYFQFGFQIETPLPSRPALTQIRAVTYLSNPHRVPPPQPQEKVITLNPSGIGTWEPDDPLQLFSFRNQKGDLDPDQGEVTMEISCLTPGVYLRIADGAAADPATGEIPVDAEFNVTFIPDRQLQVQEVPQPNPEIRGFERRGRQEIAGPRTKDMSANGGVWVESAIFRFAGKDLRNVTLDDQGNVSLALFMETYKNENADQPTFAGVQVRSLDTLRDPPFVSVVEVAEKRQMVVKVPAKFLGNADPAKRGDLIVQIACRQWGHSIYLNRDDVRIDLGQTPFVINLLKSELVIFFEVVLLIAIAVTCSVRVGWPVGMLCSAICIAFGYFVEFIMSLQEYGGLAALNYRVSGNDSPSFHFFDSLTGVIWKVLGAISAFVPNFTIYRPQDYISNLQNIPMVVVAADAFWTIVFILPLIGIAHLLFRKQELG